MWILPWLPLLGSTPPELDLVDLGGSPEKAALQGPDEWLFRYVNDVMEYGYNINQWPTSNVTEMTCMFACNTDCLENAGVIDPGGTLQEILDYPTHTGLNPPWDPIFQSPQAAIDMGANTGDHVIAKERLFRFKTMA